MRDIRDIVQDIDAIARGEVTEATVPNIVEVYKELKALEKRVAELEGGQTQQAQPAGTGAAANQDAGQPGTAQAAPAATATPTMQATRG